MNPSLPPDPNLTPQDFAISPAAIDRALAAVARAEPAPGLEARLQLALRDRLLETPAPSPSRLRLASWPAAAGLALAGALLLTFPLASRPHPTAAPSQRTPPRLQAHTHLPGPIQIPAPPTLSRLAAPGAPVRPVLRPLRTAAPRVATRPQSASPQPVSFPAPPAPLTAQERLLLQLAAQQDHRNWPSLDPGQRAAEQARAAADFQAFFPDDPTGATE